MKPERCDDFYRVDNDNIGEVVMCPKLKLSEFADKNWTKCIFSCAKVQRQNQKTITKGINMAFQNKNLSLVAYANGFTLWHYKTEDSPKTVLSNGYFNGAACILENGDAIDIAIKNNLYIRMICKQNNNITWKKVK